MNSQDELSKSAKPQDLFEKIKNPINQERLYFGILSIVCLIIILINTLSALSSVPSFCSLCHRSASTALNSTNHAKIACNSCHSGENIFQAVSWRINTASMVVNYLSGVNPNKFSGNISNNSCLKCHGQINKKTIVSKKMRVSHKEIIKAGHECTDCHSTTAHGKTSLRQNFPELGKCFNCHNDQTASAKCETCHVKGYEPDRSTRIKGSWQITHGRNWRKAHGMGETNTCKVCHSKSFCKRCHQIDLPHPLGWLSTHGKEVKSSIVAAQSCKKCHQQSLCVSCHKTEMPHPNSFLPNHSSIVKKDGDYLCKNCHQKESCDRCHSYHIHPGIPRDKLKLLRKEAGLN